MRATRILWLFTWSAVGVAACGGASEAIGDGGAARVDSSAAHDGTTGVENGDAGDAPDSPAPADAGNLADRGTGGDAAEAQDGGEGPDSGGGACANGACPSALTCCGQACANTKNDPLNCGGCGVRCQGATPMCAAGKCQAATCAPACPQANVCCLVERPGPSAPPTCHGGSTCPVGCPLCK